VEPPAESAAEPAPLPREADQATEFAIQLLQAGRAALTAGDLQAAVQAFTPVIQRGLLLNSVIEDLKRAVEEKPDATPLWQALGDAYKKANLLPEAIKAYSRARKEEDGLELARQALKLGDLALAVMHYGSLIKRKQNLDDVITDLRGAVDAEPKRPALWQALGDAYMKANRLSEAIDAYRRGMESV
jgi:cytochrome c-type biogenesis protein CcmH/NrfG